MLTAGAKCAGLYAISKRTPEGGGVSATEIHGGHLGASRMSEMKRMDGDQRAPATNAALGDVGVEVGGRHQAAARGGGPKTSGRRSWIVTAP
jgi:hypothetical protein